MPITLAFVCADFGIAILWGSRRCRTFLNS